MGEAPSTDPPGLIDAVDLPIVVLRCDGRVVRCNAAASKVLSLTPLEVGCSLRDIRALDGMVADIEELWEHVMAGGAAAQRELRAKDGSWFVVRTMAYLGTDGQRAGAVVTFTNVTGLRALIDQSIYEREHTKTILNTVSDALVVLDAEMRIQTANRAFHALFRLSREETQGIAFQHLGGGDWAATAFRERLSQCLAGAEDPPDALEVHMDLPDAGRRTLCLTMRRLPRRAGQRELVLLSIGDITDRVRAENALRDADRRKDEFLATLAHELRNPLSPLRVSLELIRRTLGSELSSVDRYLNVIERQVESLEHIVDDLLEISRITRGKIELRKERLDLSAAVSTAVETTQAAVAKRKHELSITLSEHPLVVEADPVRVQQILSNLLLNAAKYTPPGGRIWIIVEGVGEHARVRIKDTGIGISEELMPRIFGIFEQGRRDLARSEGGLGIGLSIVKTLTELHGGTVVATSPGDGKGSEFVVTFVRAPDNRPVDCGAGAKPVAGAEDIPRRRILVVDDNTDAGEMLAQLLRELGHDVRTARDGPTAIDVVGKWQADVVFLDIGLPGMDGYAVAREIRRRRIDTPLVALTGYGHESARTMSRDAGFTQHLVKPPALETILGVLRGITAGAPS